MTPTILIIEDDAALASALAKAAERCGFETECMASATRGMEAAATGNYALIVLDIGLPDRTGLELMEDLLDDDDPPPILIITAHGSMENAIEARKRGASEYMVKPFSITEFQDTIQRLKRPLPDEPNDSDETPRSRGLVGDSEAMQPVFKKIAQACTSELAVLISGETGTGKSLCAKVIHESSERQAGPFVRLHCPMFSRSDISMQTELFGQSHSAGRSTDSVRPGLLEMANGGTLFLDEIGSMSLETQPLFLRFLEEKCFRRVGGQHEIQVDCRIIAANRIPLEGEVEAGRFREDLLYRLNALHFEMPPLRDRLSDIAALTEHMLRETGFTLTEECLRALSGYDWPGNVRELSNAIDQAKLSASGGLIHASNLPESMGQNPHISSGGSLSQALDQYVNQGLHAGWNWQGFHDRLEDLLLEKLLHHFDYKSTVLARELDMNRSTLLKKRKRLEQDVHGDEA